MDLIRNGEDPPQDDPDGTRPPFFSVGDSSDTQKKKEKEKKVPKTRGISYSTHEDVLLCKCWLATSMDAICGTEQKGSRLWEKIHTLFHNQKHYVEPNPIVTTRNAGSLQHRWSAIAEDE